MSKLWKIRISGNGGQGIITTGIVLADAAVRSGKTVVQSQSYGPESRGGACRSEVIIWDKPIFYPKINRPNVLLCLSEKAFTAHFPSLVEQGVLIIDSILIPESIPGNVNAYRIPITDMTRENFGTEITANMLSLGIMVGITKVVPQDTVINAMTNCFSPDILDRNLAAFTFGLKEGKKKADLQCECTA